MFLDVSMGLVGFSSGVMGRFGVGLNQGVGGRGWVGVEVGKRKGS